VRSCRGRRCAFWVRLIWGRLPTGTNEPGYRQFTSIAILETLRNGGLARAFRSERRSGIDSGGHKIRFIWPKCRDRQDLSEARVTDYDCQASTKPSRCYLQVGRECGEH